MVFPLRDLWLSGLSILNNRADILLPRGLLSYQGYKRKSFSQSIRHIFRTAVAGSGSGTKYWKNYPLTVVTLTLWRRQSYSFWSWSETRLSSKYLLCREIVFAAVCEKDSSVEHGKFFYGKRRNIFGVTTTTITTTSAVAEPIRNRVARCGMLVRYSPSIFLSIFVTSVDSCFITEQDEWRAVVDNIPRKSILYWLVASIF